MRLSFHLVFLFAADIVAAQSNSGELRVKITDPQGLVIKAIYTAGIPAEYGRKMGLIEVDTSKDDRRGLHGTAMVSGGNNRLNLIDFAGLFSGNAIAPSRSYALRLQTTF